MAEQYFRLHALFSLPSKAPFGSRSPRTASLLPAAFLPFAFVALALGFVRSAHAAPMPSVAGPKARLASKLFQKNTAEEYLPVIARVCAQLYPELTRSEAGEALAQKGLRFVDERTKELRFLLSDSDEPNAFALLSDEESGSPAQIVLSRGVLREVADESELAFIIAHEMTHILSEHEPLLPPFVLTATQLEHISQVHRSWEFEADAEALRVLERRGFNLDAPTSVLERLSTAERKHSEDKSQDAEASHPPISERISAMNRQRGAGA